MSKTTDIPQVYIEFNARKGEYYFGILLDNGRISWYPGYYSRLFECENAAIEKYPTGIIHKKP